MADEAANSAVEFTGRFEHGVDGSHRVMIPREWRPADGKTVFTILPWPLKRPDHLLVLPPERWQSAQQRLKTGFSLTNTHGAVVQRAVAGSAVRKPLDDAGRLCLGEKLTALLGLSGKAGLVGCLDRFEIWEPGKLEETMGAIEQVADETLEQLMI